MNHLYEVATGKLISSTTLEILEIPSGMAVVSLPDGDENGIWNINTLSFDSRPIKNIVDKIVFLDRFTDSELIGILDAAESNTALKVFIKKLDIANTVDLNSDNSINGLALLESLGLLTASRSLEIRNG